MSETSGVGRIRKTLPDDSNAAEDGYLALALKLVDGIDSWKQARLWESTVLASSRHSIANTNDSVLDGFPARQASIMAVASVCAT
jgi:hypothetical protein